MQHIISELNKLSFVIAPIFYKLLFISITGALVGGVVLVIRKFFDKKIPPLWKYLMWTVVVLGLIIPFRPQSKIAVTQNISRIEDTSFREEYDEVARLAPPDNLSEAEIVQFRDNRNSIMMKSTIFDVVIPLTWLFGMCFIFLFFIGNKIYLSYKIRKSSLKSNRFDEILAKCKSQLGITGNVEIVLQDYVKSPALIGLINPKILLPIYTENMSEESLYYVLLHELSHYKRKDMLVNYVLLAVQPVHWFNPLVWLLFKFIREDMELLNDNYVLKAVGEEQNTAYAKSLVEVLGLSHNVALMPKLICMVDGKKNVERRISMIKLSETFNKHKIIVAVCCLAVICVVCGLFLTKKNDAVKKSTNELLLENRTEYVGDNSKVGGILSALSYPEKVAYENFALNTNEPPYAITVNLKTDTVTRDFYSEEAAQGAFEKIAFTMFSLIGNVEQVNFSLDDSANPYDFTVYRSQANSLLGDDYFNRTQALEGLQEVLKDIEEKVVVNYGEIKDEFVEKSELYSINPDMPNGDIQLTIQNTTEFPYFGDKNEGFAYFEKAANQLHFGIITNIGQPVATDENPVGSLAGAGVKFDYDITNNELLNVEFTNGAEGQRLDITDSELVDIATKMLQYISEDNSQSAKAITFPAYTVENPNNLHAIDGINATSPFKLLGDFPKGWEFRTANNGEENIPMGEFYTPVYIYENNKLIGYIGFNTFEPYEGEITPEDYYKSVYSSLRLSRYFRWDPYTAVTGDEISETGIVEIYYLDETEIDKHPGALASVPELESKGILSYNKNEKVYIGIAFMPNAIEREQLESIAKSVKISKVEYIK